MTRISQLHKTLKIPTTPDYKGSFTMEMTEPSPAFTNTPLRNGQRSTTPSEEEYAKPDYNNNGLRKLRLLHWVRIALSGLLIAAGAAIVGCEAHALHAYNATHLGNQWYLPLWPSTLDVRPSVAVLGGGASVILFSLIYLLIALIPSVCTVLFPHVRTFWLTWLQRHSVRGATSSTT